MRTSVFFARLFLFPQKTHFTTFLLLLILGTTGIGATPIKWLSKDQKEKAVNSKIFKKPAVDLSGTVYVKKGSTGTGASWDDALGELADALKLASTNTAITQIWVSKGTYLPLYSPADGANFADAAALTLQNKSPRERSFLLVKDLKVYGGFDPGNGITDLTHQRILPSLGNVTAGTILSGDFDANDEVVVNPDEFVYLGNYAENAIRVVVAAGDMGSAILDGVTIRGGAGAAGVIDDFNVNSIAIDNTTGFGGGMYNANAAFPISQVHFYANQAGYGAGVGNVSAGVTISDAIFSANSADYNGAAFYGMTADNNVYNGPDAITITRSIFADNRCYAWEVVSINNFPLSISHSVFYDNSTMLDAVTTTSAHVRIDNCAITGAYTGVNGTGGNLLVTNSVITASTVGITNTEGELNVMNSILWDNGAESIFTSAGTTDVTYSVVQGGYAGTGNLSSDPMFVDAATRDYHVQSCSPAINGGTPDVTGLELADTDLAGNPRIFNEGRIDIGVYESESEGAVPEILHVDQSVASNGSGCAWGTAYKSLADAIKFADENAGVKTIVIAKGTYYPEYVPYGVVSADPRDKTFAFRRDNLTLLGGYPIGGGSQRDWKTNPVVLSGDIGVENDRTDNAYHVAVSAGSSVKPISSSLVFDGVQFVNGNASGSSEVTFNEAAIGRNAGGGFYNFKSSPVMTNVTFSGNSAATGGAIINGDASSPRMINALFAGNAATDGGAVYHTAGSSPVIINATFSGNNATGSGGAVFNSAASASITNTIFHGNSSAIHNTGTPVTVSYSIVQGSYSGAGNTSLDPLFITAPSYSTAPFSGGDYNLNHCSPAIDAGGSDTTGLRLPTLDLAGARRFNYAKVDVGAYEYRIENNFTVNSEGIVYVKKGSSGSGTSWNCAMGELADALKMARISNQAVAGSVKEIWVSKGTYTPKYSPQDGMDYADSLTLGGNHTQRSFLLVKDVKLYGGFDPDNDITDLSDTRVIPDAEQETLSTGSILSGDFKRDDQVQVIAGDKLNFTNYGENALHVLITGGDAGTTLLNGFTIRGGYAGGNSVIKVNGLDVNAKYGAGLANISSAPALSHVHFYANRASERGAVYYYNATVASSITDSRFSANQANYGGAIYNTASSLTITKTSFAGNQALQSGGAMVNSSVPSLTISNTIFSGNKAVTGGAMLNSAGSPLISNSVFTGNYSGSNDAVMSNTSNAAVSIANSIIWGNSSTFANNSSTLSIKYSIVQGSYAGDGNKNSNPSFLEALSYSAAPFTTGNYRVFACSPAIGAGDNSSIGSGVTTDAAGNARVYNSGVVDMGAFEFQGPDVVEIVDGRLYVRKGFSGTGASWDCAMGELAQALKKANEDNTIREIWVAKGIYKPAYSPVDGDSFGDSTTLSLSNHARRSFLMVKDVKIYGGFDPDNGITNLTHQRILPDISPNAVRDGSVNGSVLSGDFKNNDAPITSVTALSSTDYQDNAYHVITASGDIGAALLDGFTVKSGNAREWGTYLTVKSNSFNKGVGGGLSAYKSQMTIRNVHFYANQGAWGAAVYYYLGSGFDISQSVFSNNLANLGGAISSGSAPTVITNSTFLGNRAILDGGAIHNATSITTKIYNGAFAGNVAGDQGGAIYTENTVYTLVNNLFSGNAATNEGGAIYANNFGDVVYGITNTIIWGNSSGIYHANRLSVIKNSIVQGGYTGEENLDIDPAFETAPSYAGAPFVQGNYQLKSTSWAINTGTFYAGDLDLPSTDLAGKLRVQKYRIDMGPFESSFKAPYEDLGETVFVKKGAIGTGTSWEDALGELQDALTLANANPGIKNIHVSVGTYKPSVVPSYTSATNDAVSDRDRSFHVRSGLNIYGGFDPDNDITGMEHTRIIPGTHATTSGSNKGSVLSGDIGIENDITDNCYHVVVAGATGSLVKGITLDGFTVTGGNASVEGRIELVNGSLVYRSNGGGICLLNGRNTLTNNTLIENKAISGGGIFGTYVICEMTYNVFSGNIASANGGGVFMNAVGSFSPGYNIFSGNQASNAGGGMALYTMNYQEPNQLHNNIFSGNSAGYGGGIYAYDGPHALINNTFAGNSVQGYGGAYASKGVTDQISMSNNIFWKNQLAGNSSTAGADFYSAASMSALTFRSNLMQLPEATYTGTNFSLGTQSNNLFGQDPRFLTVSKDLNVSLPAIGYQLGGCSPAINVGDNALAVLAATVDITGANRIQLGTVDLGAFEASSAEPDQSASLTEGYYVVSSVQDQTGTTAYTSGCSNLVATVTASGGHAIGGTTTAQVWIDDTQNSQYVKRHYEITPATDPETATGKVTLYFTQEEFDGFNTLNTTKLPTGPSDAAGIGRLLIEKRGGQSNNTSTGAPNTYSGSISTINPDDADVIWNALLNRWEVSFSVTGFSGFFAKTSNTALPVRWISFGSRVNTEKQIVLSWEVNETIVDRYEVERSADAVTFAVIGTVQGKGDGLNKYNLTDTRPLSGRAYYRVRQIDSDGSFSYSRMITTITATDLELAAYPSPVREQLTIRVHKEKIGKRLTLINVGGIQVGSLSLDSEITTFNMKNFTPGVYLLRSEDGQTIKILKE